MSPWLHAVHGFVPLVHCTVAGSTVQSPSSPLLSLIGAGCGRLLDHTIRASAPPEGRNDAPAGVLAQAAPPATMSAAPAAASTRSIRTKTSSLPSTGGSRR